MHLAQIGAFCYEETTHTSPYTTFAHVVAVAPSIGDLFIVPASIFLDFVQSYCDFGIIKNSYIILIIILNNSLLF